MSTSDRGVFYRLRWSGLFVVLCLLGSGSLLAESPIDLEALIHETQKRSQSPEELTLVWWLPEQFWAASLAQDPSLDWRQKEEFLATMRPYTMVVVVDGKIADGGVSYRSEASVRADVVLKDDRDVAYTPLTEDAIAPSTKKLLQVMKPLIGSALGQVGHNMHFLLFQNAEREAVADAAIDGNLKVLLRGKEFAFRLPLGSLLPPRYDTETHERFPGNYSFNPFTGKPLISEEP